MKFLSQLFSPVGNDSADHTAQLETQKVEERGTVAVTTVWDERGSYHPIIVAFGEKSAIDSEPSPWPISSLQASAHRNDLERHPIRGEQSANGRWRRRGRANVGVDPLNSTQGEASCC